MNDTFAFACSDGENMDIDDFIKAIPVIEKYEKDAFTAYVSLKRSKRAGEDIHPIKCKCCHDGPGYHKARKELQALDLSYEGWDYEDE